jgi:hypothetical protein
MNLKRIMAGEMLFVDKFLSGAAGEDAYFLFLPIIIKKLSFRRSNL